MFACFLGAYIQSFRQQEEGQQQFHRVQQVERKKTKKVNEKAKIHVGARMVIGRQKATAGPPLLNISHQTALHRRRQRLTELSDPAEGSQR